MKKEAQKLTWQLYWGWRILFLALYFVPGGIIFAVGGREQDWDTVTIGVNIIIGGTAAYLFLDGLLSQPCTERACEIAMAKIITGLIICIVALGIVALSPAF